jgi:hypothetical protein
MTVPPEALVAIGLLVAVAFVAASAERRRRRTSADPGAAEPSEAVEPPLDEDMIGTIELAPRGSTPEEGVIDRPRTGPSAEPPA